ncbi:MAG: ribonuclease P protein component [Oscillospiraceae bacterium]|jgi:ribonuclease P protein component|nr:ribonuclease P protein component [Oscillospiraceae bacterium]MBQ4000607.1 ribonuclease P protein component [Oscillospiraceae bacterium]MBQ4240615.1 ribonuclease P protein component [Oscillospiraceae bacterium]MBQ5411988.1 ribonuclease P protein component [Oscillospiraceae bacterium]
MRFETINRNYLFLRAYKSRISYVSPLIVTYIVKRRSGGIRLGITTGKKIGCAVERNRARRVVRAAASQLLRDNEESLDIVIVCRHPSCKASSNEIRDVLREHLTAAGVRVC